MKWDEKQCISKNNDDNNSNNEKTSKKNGYIFYDSCMVLGHRSSNRKGAVSLRKKSETRAFYRKICMHGYALWLKMKNHKLRHFHSHTCTTRERVCWCVCAYAQMCGTHIYVLPLSQNLKAPSDQRYEKNVVAFKLVEEHARSISLFIYKLFGCSIEEIFPFFVSFFIVIRSVCVCLYVCYSVFLFWIAFAPQFYINT